MSRLIFILFFLLPSFLFAQDEQLSVSDSLALVAKQERENLMENLREGLVKYHGAEKANKQEAMLAACMELGSLYEDHKYYSKALTYFQQAASLSNTLGLWNERLAVQTRIAESHFHNGQMEEAFEGFLEVYEQHQLFQDYEAAMVDLEHLAETSLTLGDLRDANDFYETIRELAVANEDMEVAIYATNNMGFVASRRGDTELAIEHLTEAEVASKETGHTLPVHVLTNLGIVWHNLGNEVKSLDYLLQAEASASENQPYVKHLISSIYLKDEDIYNALRYNESAVKAARKTNDLQVLSDACKMASDIFEQLFEYDKALVTYKEHLSLEDSLQRQKRLVEDELRNLHLELDRTENEIRQNLIESELEAVTIEQLELAAQTAELEAAKQKLEAEQQRQQLALLETEKQAREANLRATQLEAERTRQALQLATQQLLAEKQAREINDLSQQARLDSLESARQAAEQQQKIALLETEQELALLQKEQDEDFRQNIRIAGALVGLILLLITWSWLNSRRLNTRLKTQNERIEKQNEEIEKERNRAEGLLLNILPQSVADELKINGVATPRHYEAVTVLFTDFQGFTKVAATMSPGEVVKQLNECFLKFDEIAERHNLEKIKTMGDAYMCAGGLPEPNDTHFLDAVRAAQEIIQFIDERNRKLKAAGKTQWPIRVGIHTGELVAGVVGKKKFAYDIWGDTVNVASRMETNSEPMHINISEATYELVKDDVPCKFRGEVEVKNKGKMGMYLVEG